MLSVRGWVSGSVGLGLALGMTACGGGSSPVTTTPVSDGSLTYGTITTFAGTGKLGYGGDGGAATSGTLYQPMALAFNSSGDLFIADGADEVVRKVAAATGAISTYAGLFTRSILGGYSGNGGPATSAQFYGPFGLAVDGAGNLYIADEANNVIRMVAAETGNVSVFAGNGVLASSPNGTYTGDGGPATSAGLNHPWKIAFDKAGNLYICDTDNFVVRKVAAGTGTISTVAGTGADGYSGDGGKAAGAVLYHPEGIAFDAAGNFFLADQANNTVREVNIATGVISTVAGTGQNANAVLSGNGGPATQAMLSSPLDVAIDAAGDILIADTSDNVIRRVKVKTGVIDTIAGSTQGYSGDGGPATSAQLNNPAALAFDAAGNLYIADSANGVVRKVAVTK